MKTKIFLFLAILFSAVQIAWGENDRKVTPQELEYMKAVVARELNCVSLSENKSAKEVQTLKEIDDQTLSIEGICGILNADRNKKLTKQIGQLKPEKSESTVDEAIDYYSEAIFKEKVISDFFNKKPERKEKSDSIQGVIRACLTDHFSQIEPDVENNSETGEEEIVVVEGKETTPTDSNVETQKDNTKQDTQPSGIGFGLKLLIVILVLALIGSLAIAFILYRNLDTAHKQLRKMDFDIKDLNNRFILKTRELEVAKRDCAIINEQLNEKVSEIARLKLIERIPKSANSMDVKTAGQNKESQKHEPQLVEQTFYAVNSEGGVFSNLSKNYKRGQYLYKITTYDGASGKFEFISDSENVAIAKVSLSNFLESSCEILNEDQRSFTDVVTETPGEVVGEDNTWHIVRKAVVKLV